MRDIAFIPISALKGDNVVDAERRTCPGTRARRCWTYLETVHIASDRNLTDLRFPVQYVIRPNLDFRGFAGTVASGVIRKGDEVMVLPSGKRSRVKSIVTYDGEVPEAFAPMAVTVTLEDEIDVSRGDMLVHPDNLPRVERPDRGDGGVDGRGAVGARPDVPGEADDATWWRRRSSRLRYGVDVNTLHREDVAGLAHERGRPLHAHA